MAGSSNVSLDVCCVCLDDYSENKHTTYFVCGHQMHTGCYEAYIKTGATCPLCRYPILHDPVQNASSSYIQPIVLDRRPAQVQSHVIPIGVQIALQQQNDIESDRRTRQAMACTVFMFMVIVCATFGLLLVSL